MAAAPVSDTCRLPRRRRLG